MDPDVKQRWVQALRSGEFVQGTGALRTPLPEGGFAYCCLGVLCEIVEPGWLSRPSKDYDEDDNPVQSTNADVFNADVTVDPLRPLLEDPAPLFDLAHRNDGTTGYVRHDFNQIATYIEENL
jgi:hypothetical protein